MEYLSKKLSVCDSARLPSRFADVESVLFTDGLAPEENISEVIRLCPQSASSSKSFIGYAPAVRDSQGARGRPTTDARRPRDDAIKVCGEGKILRPKRSTMSVELCGPHSE